MRSTQYIILALLSLLVCLEACKSSKEISYTMIRSNADLEGVQIRSDNDLKFPDCQDPLTYAPYSEDVAFFDVRWIRLNFHLMNRTKRDMNFEEGTGEAEEFIRHLVQNANERLVANFKMKLPVDNKTAQLHPRYQYYIVGQEKGDDGIYYHYDDELYYFLNKGRNKNNYKKEVLEKYGVESESVLNVFFIPHHPDSVASKKYKQTTAGIALGTDIKIGSEWNNPDDPWNYATMLNHEIGHVMSLQHSWIRNDGCDDTPVHKNCYSNTGKSPCNGPVSNNMMDYNHSQMAISPCQLGKVHKVMSDINSRQRKLVREDWCNYDPDTVLIIDRKLIWNGAKDLNKDLVIEDGASLTIGCRLSMAKNAKIIVKPGGTLNLESGIIHNACGDLWAGIELQKSKKKEAIFLHNTEAQVLNVKAED